MELETELAAIAAGTASEGCVEVLHTRQAQHHPAFNLPSLVMVVSVRVSQETLSCLVLAEASSRCDDACVRTALTSIVKAILSC